VRTSLLLYEEASEPPARAAVMITTMKESLVEAFEGASAIFAMTDFFELYAKHGPHKAIEIEQKQGENIARAASKTLDSSTSSGVLFRMATL
jgi:hypothetical protein